ncbi:1,2-phenylacetyl-CoA epoxidase subunit PaaD [Gynurincola endophyticus]|jgi:ring-1,2-phenylacetyl-CoA epoxidase subunit PaaD|uniref:1,2-phenylacetyl-CoA epoxidase subunit PaaD n=1 Tax=Gynurincola endophyticus TaxID=2479004 RepID=UPI000F8E0967|nr:1,2-phenylacetyl-CoA epoxidase subunit PaaD [Gynurincola endophyticus]
MVNPSTISKDELSILLEQIHDPEIPVLTIQDLGMVRDVSWVNDHWKIVITPTYTACPAVDAILEDIGTLLNQQNIPHQLEVTLSPAWTTDWMTQQARQKLKAYGIAPPVEQSDHVCGIQLFQKEVTVHCPQCNSDQTSLLSSFGSTACKALYKCNHCLETFDYFKCH